MVGVALVGLGWWGRKMGALIKKQSREIELVRAVEPNAAAAKEVGDELGIPITADLKAALDDPKVDAVILATPHALHSEQIRQTVVARKHVFCEKPLALTRKEAIASVDLCKSAGLVLGMGHERRFEPPIAANPHRLRRGPARDAPPDRGQLQPRQVPIARSVELASASRSRPGRWHDSDRHPPDRSLGRAHGAGDRRCSSLASNADRSCRAAIRSAPMSASLAAALHIFPRILRCLSYRASRSMGRMAGSKCATRRMSRRPRDGSSSKGARAHGSRPKRSARPSPCLIILRLSRKPSKASRSIRSPATSLSRTFRFWNRSFEARRPDALRA